VGSGDWRLGISGWGLGISGWLLGNCGWGVGKFFSRKGRKAPTGAPTESGQVRGRDACARHRMGGTRFRADW